MVKLASARECRMYGGRVYRNRGEYMNAGLYVFATVVLMGGFVAAAFSMEPKSGLVLLLIALGLITLVNLHDLFAHLAGIDYRLSLMAYDLQLALVEFAVPLILASGAFLSFISFLFLFIQEGKRYGYYRWEKHALNMLVAGTLLWVVGSVHNSCQVYDRADGHVQILQHTVHLPFLMGSLLFFLGAIINTPQQAGLDHHGLDLLGCTLLWMAIFGSLLFFIGGLTNVVKVFKMQQIDGPRLEKLRGGAQERLMQAREGQVPLISEEQRRRQRVLAEEVKSATVPVPAALPTPYKDVLIAKS